MNVSKFQIGVVFLLLFFSLTHYSLHAQENKHCEQLMKAIKAYDISGVEAALKAGADIDCMVENNHSYRKTGADIPIIRDFIDDPIRKNFITETPLHAAIRYHVDPIFMVKYLISQGANLEILDSKGYAAIHLVSARFNYQCFKYFLAKQPNLNIETLGGNTLLHKLIDYKDTRGIKLLLQKEGVWVSMKDGLKSPVIHEIFETDALFQRFPNTDLLELLIRKGADINEKNSRGKTCLEIAMYYKHSLHVNFALKRGGIMSENYVIRGYSSASTAALLFRNGMIPQPRAFNCAIRVENEPLVRTYLRFHVDHSSIYPFHTAALTNNKSMIQALIDGGLDINQRNQYGESILLTAARMQLKQLDFLEDKMAHGVFTEVMKKPPIDTTFIKYLFHAGLQKNPVELNICLDQLQHYTDDQAYYDFFIRLGADSQVVNRSEPVDNQTLKEYVNQNKYEGLRLLLEYKYISNKGQLLADAIEANQTRIIKLLLDHGASPNYVVEDHEEAYTLLFRAVEKGDSELANLLLHHRGNPNLKKWNKAKTWGMTPLNQAIRLKREDLVLLLLRHQANPNIDEPVETAREQENLLQLLLLHGAKPSNFSFTSLVLHQTYTEKTLCLMVKRGIDVTQRVNNTTSKYYLYLPIEIALAQQQEKLVNCMLKQEGDIEEMNHRASIEDINITKLYAENQINPQQIKEFLRQRVNVNKVYNGDRMIHIAIMKKDESLIKALIAYGVNLNKRGSQFKKPYRLARKYKLSTEVLQLLKR